MSGLKVEEAIRLVLENVRPLSAETVLLTPDLLGRVLAEDVVSKENIPAFPASIMDGYAVCAPLQAGVYRIQERVHAGDVPQAVALGEGESNTAVTYITTGSMLPAGANAVVKVEDTEVVEDGMVQVKVDVPVGKWLRQVGSDVRKGELVLSAGQPIGPVEMGLLATIGSTRVQCFKKPVVGVMSTGNELVDPWTEQLSGSQVRDCNRISLLASLREDGYAEAVDLGIVKDVKEKLRECLVAASERCDVVMSSGGVSMGAADFVKPLLTELGTIHFNRLNMKPGKPTTFASLVDAVSGKQTLFFGLPGNPCSCMVTKNLFVDVALRRLQGMESADCLHSQLDVRLGEALPLDEERAEYHRATLQVDSGRDGSSGLLIAHSTGVQRSSRLLSMRSANALLCLPRASQADTKREKGSVVKALITRKLPPPSFASGQSAHPYAAGLDYPLTQVAAVAAVAATESSSGSSDAVKPSAWRATNTPLAVRVGVVTVSDRASKGVYKDESGPEVAKLIERMSSDASWPMTATVERTALVADNVADIQAIIERWTDPASAHCVDLLLTSGGTGFGLRDQTPEAVTPLLHRAAPGVAQALINEGLKHTSLAALSRPVVGTRHRTLIATLPGSVKAVRENIAALKPLLPRIFELLKEGSN